MKEKKEESELFIASNTTSLEDFLKTELCIEKHIYCCFPSQSMNYLHCLELNQRSIRSISFQNGQTLYPPFTLPKRDR